jgi:DNA polymerase-3 subunit beta
VNKIEQLNIEGKRSGTGFIAHKAMLVSALSRALADRIQLMDLAIGRKGLLGYLKAVGGSNVVKVIPSNGSASGSQATDKRLKVICGANTSYLEDGFWIGENTPMTLCDVRVSPSNSVKPNVGTGELAEALARVLPFTAREDNRPVLQCVNFEAKDGKLTLVSADGFRLAVVNLGYDDGEGQALISRDDLRGMVNALKRSKRVRVGFEDGGDKLTSKSLIIDTELVRYKFLSWDGSYPDWQKLVPTEHKTTVHLDTTEATRAVSSLKALSDSKTYPIDLNIGEGKIVMANPDDKGQAELSADTDGETIKVRIDGGYLAQALRAFGGMVELKLTSPSSPVLFAIDGYQLVVMPMLTDEVKKAEAKKATEEPKAAEPAVDTEPEPTESQPEAEKVSTVAEAEAVVKETKPKRKNRVKEPVAVA